MVFLRLGSLFFYCRFKGSPRNLLVLCRNQSRLIRLVVLTAGFQVLCPGGLFIGCGNIKELTLFSRKYLRLSFRSLFLSIKWSRIILRLHNILRQCKIIHHPQSIRIFSWYWDDQDFLVNLFRWLWFGNSLFRTKLF